MRNSQRLVLFAAALMTGAAFVMPSRQAAAFAGDYVAAADPGFVPDTGQINRGFDPKVPTMSQPLPIPTAAQARAAKMTPDSNQPLAPQNTTTGSSFVQQPSGPIGATGQTMPAKFSQRNDTLDRVPIMALPMPLNNQERHRIYQAVMMDKTPAANDLNRLSPATELDANQSLDEVHPLPASVADIAGIRSLAYVKSKTKVWLVEPDTRIVVDEIAS